jgi:hypothetical protein
MILDATSLYVLRCPRSRVVTYTLHTMYEHKAVEIKQLLVSIQYSKTSLTEGGGKLSELSAHAFTRAHRAQCAQNCQLSLSIERVILTHCRSYFTKIVDTARSFHYILLRTLFFQLISHFLI